MEEYSNIPPQRSQKKLRTIIFSLIGVLVLALGGVIAWLLSENQKKDEAVKAEQEKNMEYINMVVNDMEAEYDQVSADFQQYEGQLITLTNDSIRAEYEKAKNRVEELREELKRRDKLSREEISKLKAEIATLKDLLRHYVEVINELQQENASLKEDNKQLARRTSELTSQVHRTASENKELSERITLAEKLNISSVRLSALNSKGKNEKKVKKARQLMVTFTIPQNNTTPVGRKSIYVRITSPEGNLLRSNGITFPFEGVTLEASAKKDVEYEGKEIPSVAIYWDNNTTLNPGAYLVEIFADNFRLYSAEQTLE